MARFQALWRQNQPRAPDRAANGAGVGHRIVSILVGETMIGFLIVGAAIGGGTYAYAKQRQAGDGTSAAAAALAGVGSAAAAAMLEPLLLPALIVGLPLGYFYLKKKKPKALPPGSSS